MPCPEPGVSADILLTWVDAVHPHSCRVVIVTTPFPPLAETLEADRLTSHLTGDGPAEVVEEDPQPLTLILRKIAMSHHASRHRLTGRRWRRAAHGLTVRVAITLRAILDLVLEVKWHEGGGAELTCATPRGILGALWSQAVALEELPHDRRRVDFILRPPVAEAVDANHADLGTIGARFVAHRGERTRRIVEYHLRLA